MRAKAQYALWTTADQAFEKAREAARAGDSAAVSSLARQVSDLARLGLEQKHYPSTELK